MSRPDRRKRGGSSISLLQLALPFLVFAAAVLASAFHKLLGSPLGEAAAAKLNDVWQTLALMLVAYGPMTVYVQRQNALAQTHEERRRLPDGPRPDGEEADDEHHHRQRRIPGPRDPR